MLLIIHINNSTNLKNSRVREREREKSTREKYLVILHHTPDNFSFNCIVCLELRRKVRCGQGKRWKEKEIGSDDKIADRTQLLLLLLGRPPPLGERFSLNYGARRGKTTSTAAGEH